MQEPMSREGKWFTAWFIFCVMAVLAFWGFIAWCIYRIVEHYT